MKRKEHLSGLALLGISAGLMLGGCQKNPGATTDKHNGTPTSGNKASTVEQLSPDLQSFYSSLSPDAQKKFMQLDAQHRMMAVEMANQPGPGQNKCAGLGGCQTAQHDCAGKNSCKGQGGPPVSSPNKAVDVQYSHQKNQRQKANGTMNSDADSSTKNNSQQQ